MSGKERDYRKPVGVSEFARQARQTQPGISYLLDGRIVHFAAESRRLHSEETFSLAVFSPDREYGENGRSVLHGYQVNVAKLLLHKPEITATSFTIMTRGKRPGVILDRQVHEMDPQSFDFFALMEPLEAVEAKKTLADKPEISLPEKLISVSKFMQETIGELVSLKDEQQPDKAPPILIHSKPVERNRRIYQFTDNDNTTEIERYKNGLELDRVTFHTDGEPPLVLEINYAEGTMRKANIEKQIGEDAELENYETTSASPEERTYLVHMLASIADALLPQSDDG